MEAQLGEKPMLSLRAIRKFLQRLNEHLNLKDITNTEKQSYVNRGARKISKVLLYSFKQAVDVDMQLEWLRLPAFLMEKGAQCQKIALLLNNMFQKVYQRQKAYLDFWQSGEAQRQANVQIYNRLMSVKKKERLVPSKLLTDKVLKTPRWAFEKKAQEADPTEVTLTLGLETHIIKLRPNDQKQLKKLNTLISQLYKI